MNFVCLHLAHGGRVSSWSSSTTDLPQWLQTYTPLPGFCPVVDMIAAPGIEESSRESRNARSSRASANASIWSDAILPIRMYAEPAIDSPATTLLAGREGAFSAAGYTAVRLARWRAVVPGGLADGHAGGACDVTAIDLAVASGDAQFPRPRSRNSTIA